MRDMSGSLGAAVEPQSGTAVPYRSRGEIPGRRAPAHDPSRVRKRRSGARPGARSNQIRLHPRKEMTLPTLPHPSDRGKHPARTTVVDRRAEALGIPAGGRLRTPLLGDDLQTPGGQLAAVGRQVETLSHHQRVGVAGVEGLQRGAQRWPVVGGTAPLTPATPISPASSQPRSAMADRVPSIGDRSPQPTPPRPPRRGRRRHPTPTAHHPPRRPRPRRPQRDRRPLGLPPRRRPRQRRPTLHLTRPGPAVAAGGPSGYPRRRCEPPRVGDGRRPLALRQHTSRRRRRRDSVASQAPCPVTSADTSDEERIPLICSPPDPNRSPGGTAGAGRTAMPCGKPPCPSR